VQERGAARVFSRRRTPAQGPTTTPQGPLPTGTFFKTLKLEVSMIVTSFDEPLAVNNRFPS
jgi:hypothetical protein